jgi:ADP-heptose:LPS heptosyltransferase
VALSALGLQRDGVPIELQVDPIAKQRVASLLEPFHLLRTAKHHEPLPLLGVNIGCGTPDALYKRPELENLVQAVVAFLKCHPHDIVLTGAPFEKEVNEAFAHLLSKRWSELAKGMREPLVWDGAGRTSMTELSALIGACQLFVSTDSGPYHMAVALRVPTFCWFVVNEPSSLHQETWCNSSLNPSVEDFVQKTKGLLPLVNT